MEKLASEMGQRGRGFLIGVEMIDYLVVTTNSVLCFYNFITISIYAS